MSKPFAGILVSFHPICYVPSMKINTHFAKQLFQIVLVTLIAYLLAGCTSTGDTRTPVNDHRLTSDAMKPRKSKSLSTNSKPRKRSEEQVLIAAKSIRPGLTLSQCNKLVGWRAEWRAGNWFWSPTGGLLVQTEESPRAMASDPRVLAVYDFYRSEQRFIKDGKIVISKIPDEANPYQLARPWSRDTVKQ